MNRIISLLLVFAICLPLCACSAGNADTSSPKEEVAETKQPIFKDPKQEAFEISKEAYKSLVTAYEAVNEISSDVYEAWRIGISEEDAVRSGGCKYLASKLTLNEEEIRNGVAYTNYGDSWENTSEEDREKARLLADDFFKWNKYVAFALTVRSVIGAYRANGKIDNVQKELSNSKALMRKLSNEYSDYEYYPNLKDYYTTVNAFLDYCLDPDGSFNQAIDTINNYRNEARNYQNDLDFVFGD